MAVGSIEIEDDGTEVVVAGATPRLYDWLKVMHETNADAPIPSGADGVPVKRGLALAATMFSQWLVGELTLHLTAQVSAGGLQRVGGTATDAPASPQSIPLVHS